MIEDNAPVRLDGLAAEAALNGPEVEFPEAFADLFKPSRYKFFYGGRGGAKSWNFARALLVKGAEKPLRILCAREFQKSIDDSVHSLLCDQIAQMGMGDFYHPQKKNIAGRNGTSFGYAGLHHNITELKGWEGADIVWVEEAQVVSDASWNILIPTVRKDGSEIWGSFNPDLEDDATYKRFVMNPPPHSIVKKVGWSDNPWFPDVLKAELDHLRETDHDAYLNVWEGYCKQVLEGAVYANEIRKVKEDGRLRHVPYDPSAPAFVSFDLGWSDSTAVWVSQKIAGEARIPLYYENRSQPISHYFAKLAEFGVLVDTVFLPHDAEQQTLAASGKTMKERVEALGFKVQIVPRLSVAEGIEAARAFFPYCFFDEKNAADGFRMLSRYQYDYSEDHQVFKRNPLHNFASHGADSFRYMAIMAERMSVRPTAKPIQYRRRVIA